MNEQQPTFDADNYTIAQRDQWNKDAEAWHRWNPALDRWVGDVAQEMLDMAMITTGQRILDVAAGAGEPVLNTAAKINADNEIGESVIKMLEDLP